MESNSRDYDPVLPEDLKIFISMDTKDPQEDDCEMAILQKDIAKMNKNGKRTIIFGKQKER